MSWSFSAVDGSLFLMVNGRRARGEAGVFAPVKEVGPGRSADELWDKVVLARRFRDTGDAEWKKKAADTIGCVGKEKCSVDSLSTVMSVAGYEPEEYDATVNLFGDFEKTCNEPGKSFPQNLFRELQGIQSGRLAYLRDAIGTNGMKQANKCRRQKIKTNYRQAFIQLVQADSWELAQEEHADGCRKVDEIAERETAVKRKYIPKEIIDLAEACNNFEAMEEEIKVDIKITKGKSDITNSESVKNIIQKHRQSIKKEIKRISSINES